MMPKSIRWRLQLWQGFLLVCLLSGFGFTAFQFYRANRLSQIDEELGRRVAALTADVRRPPGGPPPFVPNRPDDLSQPGRRGEGPPHPHIRQGGPGSFDPGRMGEPRAFAPFDPARWLADRSLELLPHTQALFDETATNGFYYAVWFRGDTLLKRSTNAPPDLAVPPATSGSPGIRNRMRAAQREAFLVTEMGDCVLVGRSILADLRALRRFAWWLAGAGLGVLAIGLGGGGVIIGRAIRPVETISAAASRISGGNLAERIPIREADSELGRLAGVLNRAFARLETAFNQQRQFTADASHELRTPIAVLLSETQTTLSRERSSAEYRETIEACQDTAQQMRRLTESLLELARFDAGQEPMQRNSLDLAELARTCTEAIRPLARERGILLNTDLHPAPTLGDPDRLRQVVINLLTNAIHYNRDGGEVHVSSGITEGWVRLQVTDTGPGIAPEKLPHVFDRFYRADPSRARAEGRTGLGLAISRAIVEAHEGRLEAASEHGEGSTFSVSLPSEGRPVA